MWNLHNHVSYNKIPADVRDVRGYFILDRFGELPPLRVPIRLATLHEVSPRSLYRTGDGIPTLERDCEGRAVLPNFGANVRCR